MRGIYKIENNKDRMIYIGSSENIMKRWDNHIYMLNKNEHHSYKMQNSWKSNSITDFKFSILEVVPIHQDLKEVEQKYIDKLDMSVSYNITDSTTYRDVKIDEDYIYKINFSNMLKPMQIKSLKNNLNIHDKSGDKMIQLGSKTNDLSKSWFAKNRDGVEQLSKNVKNYILNKLEVKTTDSYWTTFSQYQRKTAYYGYEKNYLPLNIENIIDRRNNICFCVNLFVNRFIKRKYDINITDNEYALSFMLFWICNVTDINKEINIYIPSKRMENILKNWINS